LENPSNWSCTAVPDDFTDVFVNTGESNYTEINSMASCRTFKPHSGARVMVKTGYNLNITGNE